MQCVPWPWRVLYRLTEDEGLRGDRAADEVRVVDVEAGVQHRDPDPSTGPRRRGHPGGLQAPGELVVVDRDRGQCSRACRPVVAVQPLVQIRHSVVVAARIVGDRQRVVDQFRLHRQHDVALGGGGDQRRALVWVCRDDGDAELVEHRGVGFVGHAHRYGLDSKSLLRATFEKPAMVASARAGLVRPDLGASTTTWRPVYKAPLGVGVVIPVSPVPYGAE